MILSVLAASLEQAFEDRLSGGQMALDPQLPIPYELTAPVVNAAGSPVAPPRRNGAALATQAARILAEARAWVDPDERFRLAHLGGVRPAAALVADRARPAVRRRPTNAWVLLAQVAPELADWATYFAAGAPKRAAIEAG